MTIWIMIPLLSWPLFLDITNLGVQQKQSRPIKQKVPPHLLCTSMIDNYLYQILDKQQTSHTPYIRFIKRYTAIFNLKNMYLLSHKHKLIQYQFTNSYTNLTIWTDVQHLRSDKIKFRNIFHLHFFKILYVYLQSYLDFLL